MRAGAVRNLTRRERSVRRRPAAEKSRALICRYAGRDRSAV
jgi:hypothetical protein